MRHSSGRDAPPDAPGMKETFPSPDQQFPGLPKSLRVWCIQEDEEEGGVVFRVRLASDPVRPGDPRYAAEDDITILSSGMYDRLFVPGVPEHFRVKLGTPKDLMRYVTPALLADYEKLVQRRCEERARKVTPA